MVLQFVGSKFYIFSINKSRSLKEEKGHGLRLRIALAAQHVTNY
jgi:urease beta subunit